MQPNCVKSAEAGELTSESVQSAALPLEGVHSWVRRLNEEKS